MRRRRCAWISPITAGSEGRMAQAGAHPQPDWHLQPEEERGDTRAGDSFPAAVSPPCASDQGPRTLTLFPQPHGSSNLCPELWVSRDLGLGRSNCLLVSPPWVPTAQDT